MAAPNQVDDVIVDRDVVPRLKKRFKNKIALEDESDWRSLAQSLITTSYLIRVPRPTATFKKLLWWRIEDKKAAELETGEGDAELRDDLKGAVEALCSLGVLIQGFEWLCTQCSHRNWRTVEDLTSLLQCAVCHYATRLPAEFEWTFLLNEFLAEAIREYGIRGVVVILGLLHYNAQESFIFSPQLELFESEKERAKPDAEIDLCFSRDGLFGIGEVKESSDAFGMSVAKDLIATSQRLHPHIVVLGSLDARGRPRLEQLAKHISDALAYKPQVAVILPDPAANAYESSLLG